MIDKSKVETIVNEWLVGKDYFLTDISVSPDDRIVVEIDHKEGVWIDDCVQLSQYIEARLDRDTEDYELEVGSAGIGQPFKVHRQYENHIGEQVEVLTDAGEKLKGTLKEVNDGNFTVTTRVRFKPEGAKRAKMIDEDRTMAYTDVKFTRAVINFK